MNDARLLSLLRELDDALSRREQACDSLLAALEADDLQGAGRCLEAVRDAIEVRDRLARAIASQIAGTDAAL